MQHRGVSHRVAALAAATEPVSNFLTGSTWARRQHEPGIVDFTFGNPHEMPLPAFVDALRQWSTPLTKDWFAYKTNEAAACEIVATSLRKQHGVPFEPAGIAMTNGGFAAISVGMKAVTDPGDEAIINLPPWFFYEALASEAGLKPVKVNVNPQSFDLDLNLIERALSPRTRVIIINSPNNPTGRIYPQETLRRLADLLNDATRRYGRTIYILSDEPYNRIVFDGRRSISPVEVYPHTMIAYSYSKILMAPGQRIGYLALPTWMPERDAVRANIETIQVSAGWAFPNALMLHALSDFEETSIDIDHLQRKRDHLAPALRRMGYEVNIPEGTFYLLVKSPLPDDEAFAEILTGHDVFVLPGKVFEYPGYFRISLTASDDMIERSLSGFAAAIACARSRRVAAR